MLLKNIKVKVVEEIVSEHLSVTIRECACSIHDHNPLFQFNWTMSSEQDSSEVKTRVQLSSQKNMVTFCPKSDQPEIY